MRHYFISTIISWNHSIFKHSTKALLCFTQQFTRKWKKHWSYTPESQLFSWENDEKKRVGIILHNKLELAINPFDSQQAANTIFCTEIFEKRSFC